MKEDKEIDILQLNIQQLINRCIILNKDEMTATARMFLGRDIVLQFRKICEQTASELIKHSLLEGDE